MGEAVGSSGPWGEGCRPPPSPYAYCLHEAPSPGGSSVGESVGSLVGEAVGSHCRHLISTAIEPTKSPTDLPTEAHLPTEAAIGTARASFPPRYQL